MERGLPSEWEPRVPREAGQLILLHLFLPRGTDHCPLGRSESTGQTNTRDNEQFAETAARSVLRGPLRRRQDVREGREAGHRQHRVAARAVDTQELFRPLKLPTEDADRSLCLLLERG